MPDDLAALLLTLEQRLLDPDIRRDRERAGELLAEDFREFGSSGRAFDRDAILGLLGNEGASAAGGPVAGITEFEVAMVGPEVALATYTASAPGRVSRRSSLWVFRNGKWLLLFHQATPLRGCGSEGDEKIGLRACP